MRQTFTFVENVKPPILDLRQYLVFFKTRILQKLGITPRPTRDPNIQIYSKRNRNLGNFFFLQKLALNVLLTDNFQSRLFLHIKKFYQIVALAKSRANKLLYTEK